MIMETATLPRQEKELQDIQNELAFASVETIEQLRDQQEAMLYNAGREAVTSLSFEDAFLKGNSVRKEARNRAAEGINEQLDTYLSAHIDRDENPARYDQLLNLLQNTSLYAMGNAKWYLGDQDENGEYTRPETSGRYQANETLRQIAREVLSERNGKKEPIPDDPVTVFDDSGEEPAEEAEEITLTPERLAYNESIDALDEARNRLAQLSVKRRLLITNKRKKNRDLELEFDDAQAEYDNAYYRSSVLALRALRSEGVTDEEEIRQAVIMGNIEERRQFTESEYTALEADQSTRAKVARWLAAGKRQLRLFGTSAITGGVTGFGLGKALKGAALAASVATGPVALGAGIATKSTKGILTANIGNRYQMLTHFDERAKKDIESMAKVANSNYSGEYSDEDYARESRNALHKAINNRIEKDQQFNRHRVVMSAAIGGGGAVIGALLSNVIEMPDWFKGNDTDANGGNGDMAPETPNNGSVLPPAPEVDEPFAPDTTAPHLPEDIPESTPTPSTSEAYGFNPEVTVEQGHGFTHELQDLAAQKSIQLSPRESYDLYQYLAERYQGDMFMQANDAYRMANGDWGINNWGDATWRPEVLRDIDEWLKLHKKSS